jgi:hypothetical protein
VDKQTYPIGGRGWENLQFTVTTRSVSYHLTGRLETSSTADGGAINQGGSSVQLGPTGGPYLVNLVTSSSASSGLPQSIPLDFHGTLPPGTYVIEMQAFASSADGVNAEGGTQTFTLELGQ